jgi:hypothetical protein
MFGEELKIQDLLSAGGQAPQQMRLAATRGSAHHHQLKLVCKAAVFRTNMMYRKIHKIINLYGTTNFREKKF